MIFSGNRASRLGGALKLLFDYSEMKEDSSYPTIFSGNRDFEGLDISTRNPAYYIFSFYDVIIETTFEGNENLTEWTQDSAKTVNISDFYFNLNIEACLSL